MWGPGPAEAQSTTDDDDDDERAVTDDVDDNNGRQKGSLSIVSLVRRTLGHGRGGV